MFFTSCYKNEDIKNPIAENNSKINQAAIFQTLTNTSIDNQKTMYRALNSYEKNEIWQQRFGDYIANNNLTKPQLDFVTKIIGKLSPQLFEVGAATEKMINEKAIREDAIKLFGIDEAAFIFADISPSYSNVNTPPEGGTGCKCSRTSDWCATYMTCEKITCTSQDGCGLLFLHTCNGMCSI